MVVKNIVSKPVVKEAFGWNDNYKLPEVPVYPQEIMEEAGATYTYPPWSGPWDGQ